MQFALYHTISNCRLTGAVNFLMWEILFAPPSNLFVAELSYILHHLFMIFQEVKQINVRSVGFFGFFSAPFV